MGGTSSCDEKVSCAPDSSVAQLVNRPWAACVAAKPRCSPCSLPPPDCCWESESKRLCHVDCKVRRVVLRKRRKASASKPVFGWFAGRGDAVFVEIWPILGPDEAKRTQMAQREMSSDQNDKEVWVWDNARGASSSSGSEGALTFQLPVSMDLSLRVLGDRCAVGGVKPPLEFLGDARIGILDDVLPASGRPEGELSLPLVLHERVCGSVSLTVMFSWAQPSPRTELLLTLTDACAECSDCCFSDDVVASGEGGEHEGSISGPRLPHQMIWCGTRDLRSPLCVMRSCASAGSAHEEGASGAGGKPPKRPNKLTGQQQVSDLANAFDEDLCQDLLGVCQTGVPVGQEFDVAAATAGAQADEMAARSLAASAAAVAAEAAVSQLRLRLEEEKAEAAKELQLMRTMQSCSSEEIERLRDSQDRAEHEEVAQLREQLQRQQWLATEEAGRREKQVANSRDQIVALRARLDQQEALVRDVHRCGVATEAARGEAREFASEVSRWRGAHDKVVYHGAVNTNVALEEANELRTESICLRRDMDLEEKASQGRAANDQSEISALKAELRIQHARARTLGEQSEFSALKQELQRELAKANQDMRFQEEDAARAKEEVAELAAQAKAEASVAGQVQVQDGAERAKPCYPSPLCSGLCAAIVDTHDDTTQDIIRGLRADAELLRMHPDARELHSMIPTRQVIPKLDLGVAAKMRNEDDADDDAGWEMDMGTLEDGVPSMEAGALEDICSLEDKTAQNSTAWNFSVPRQASTMSSSCTSGVSSIRSEERHLLVAAAAQASPDDPITAL